MKYTFSIASLAIFALIYVACQKDQKNEQTHLELIPLSGKLTMRTLSVGIKKLTLISVEHNKATYAFRGAIEGNFIYKQLSDNEVELSLAYGTNKMTLYGNKKSMIYREKGIDLMADPAPNARTMSMPLSIEEYTDIATTLALFNEITMADIERFDPPFIDVRLCRRTAVSIRVTKSSSIDHLNTFVDAYLGNHKDCSRLHGVDSGCLWGDFGCVSSQELQCSSC